MIKTVLIDDEPIAHEVLLHHIKRHDCLQVVAQCYNATEALKVLANIQVELLFLDVEMPGLNGVEMLKVIGQKTAVIIVSAHAEYAIDGFELDVLDYLLKPVANQRFDQALNKYIQASKLDIEEGKSLSIKVGRGLEKVTISEILYLESYGNYVKVWTSEGMTLANHTLKSLLAELPETQFSRISKSLVINLTHVQSVYGSSITLSNGDIKKSSKMFIVNPEKLLK